MEGRPRHLEQMKLMESRREKSSVSSPTSPVSAREKKDKALSPTSKSKSPSSQRQVALIEESRFYQEHVRLWLEENQNQPEAKDKLSELELLNNLFNECLDLKADRVLDKFAISACEKIKIYQKGTSEEIKARFLRHINNLIIAYENQTFLQTAPQIKQYASRRQRLLNLLTESTESLSSHLNDRNLYAEAFGVLAIPTTICFTLYGLNIGDRNSEKGLGAIMAFGLVVLALIFLFKNKYYQLDVLCMNHIYERIHNKIAPSDHLAEAKIESKGDDATAPVVIREERSRSILNLFKRDDSDASRAGVEGESTELTTWHRGNPVKPPSPTGPS